MGPSGSGKTSLLTALAGRVPAGSGMLLSGNLTVNGLPLGENCHRQVGSRGEGRGNGRDL